MNNNQELYHHGVKGMKWGVRKNKNTGGIAGAIRRKQRTNAENDLNKIRSKQRQVNGELRELRGYENNPSKLGRSKVSTAIRRNQIKSLEKTKDSLKKLEQKNINALKELDAIEKHQTMKAADKAAKKLSETKIKDLEKRYGELEDQMSYGRNADVKANAKIEQQMDALNRKMKELKG
jgi:flagellar biosynthesis chaperone FliJ